MRSKTLQLVAAGLLLIAIVPAISSLIPGMDWSTFDRTSAVGPLDYTLSADFDAVGFEYEIRTAPAGGGGGVIGGIGGGLGANITREEEWKTYPEVRGEVLENLGIIYDSYKDKSYIYELLMRDPPEEANINWDEPGSPAALLNVSLKADLVPFWPEGSSRPLDVRVTFLGSELEDQLPTGFDDRLEITLSRIVMKAKTGYDRETGEYEGETVTLETLEIEEVFREARDEFHASVDVKYPEGEDAAGFIVEIEASMVDHWGRPERSPLSGKANPINIRPVAVSKIARGLGIPGAAPLIITSVMLSAVAAVLILVRKRPSVGLVAPAFVLALIAPLWFATGMNSAVELLSERLSGAETALDWSAGIYLAVASALLILPALVLTILSRVLERKEEPSEEPPGEGPRFRKLEGVKRPLSGPTFRRLPSEEEEAGKDPEAPNGRSSPPPPPIDPAS